MPAVKVWHVPTSSWVTVGGSGPTGPQGPPGPEGPPGSTYHHVQGVADTTWTVTHSLGFYPAVSVIDSGGSLVECTVVYSSVNQVVLTFSYPVSGTADFS